MNPVRLFWYEFKTFLLYFYKVTANIENEIYETLQEIEQNQEKENRKEKDKNNNKESPFK